MKSTELKKMIKEAVKEAIQEELKEILLEAVRAPKWSSVAVVQEAQTSTQPSMTAEQKRTAYQNILGETSAAFTSQDAQAFRPQAGYDAANGTLPSGNVGMDQIMNLMNAK